jgi:hypothetical protein
VGNSHFLTNQRRLARPAGLEPAGLALEGLRSLLGRCFLFNNFPDVPRPLTRPDDSELKLYLALFHLAAALIAVRRF